MKSCTANRLAGFLEVEADQAGKLLVQRVHLPQLLVLPCGRFLMFY